MSVLELFEKLISCGISSSFHKIPSCFPRLYENCNLSTFFPQNSQKPKISFSEEKYQDMQLQCKNYSLLGLRNYLSKRYQIKWLKACFFTKKLLWWEEKPITTSLSRSLWPIRFLKHLKEPETLSWDNIFYKKSTSVCTFWYPPPFGPSTPATKLKIRTKIFLWKRLYVYWILMGEISELVVGIYQIASEKNSY